VTAAEQRALVEHLLREGWTLDEAEFEVEDLLARAEHDPHAERSLAELRASV
jgi:hypothetical protein